MSQLRRDVEAALNEAMYEVAEDCYEKLCDTARTLVDHIEKLEARIAQLEADQRPARPNATHMLSMDHREAYAKAGRLRVGDYVQGLALPGKCRIENVTRIDRVLVEWSMGEVRGSLELAPSGARCVFADPE